MSKFVWFPVGLLLALPSFAEVHAKGLLFRKHTAPEVVAIPGNLDIHDFRLIDKSRGDREIPVRAYVPKGKGPFPTVLFSPGLGGSRETYVYLAIAWAAAGYLVLIPTHAGSATDDMNTLGGNLIGKGIKAVRIVSDQRNWTNRVQDMQYLLAHTQEVEFLAGKIDKEKIALAGHSFGAQTALAGTGAKIHLSGKENPSLLIPEAKIAIAISPQGEGRMGFKDDSWSELSKPTLFIRGERDAGIFGDAPETRDHPFQHAPSNGKMYHALIPGEHATHMFFVGDGVTAKAKESVKDVEELTLTFLNKFLKKNSPTEIATEGTREGRVVLKTK